MRYNLAPAFLDTVVKRYRGTRLGRQELDGEIIEERAGALWWRARSRRPRRCCAAMLAHRGGGRSAGARDQTFRRLRAGCGGPRGRLDLRAGGRDRHGPLARRMGPQGDRAVAQVEADSLVVEVNQGGDMVRAVIREADATCR